MSEEGRETEYRREPEEGDHPERGEPTFRQGLDPLDKAMRRRNRRWVHLLLFFLTLVTTTYAGIGFLVPVESAAMPWEIFLENIPEGLSFSLLLLLFLSAHEFGHYFAARYYKVDVTLPYYIPMPFFFFGTMGAVIRIRSQVPSRKAIFDIGVAGPIAGFVVAFIFLVIGMAAGPDPNHLYAIHPDYRGMVSLPDEGIHFGGFLLFDLLKLIIVPEGSFFPGMNEIYHYPLLAVGWFGMFVTALNMLPVGQLDGGHVLYGMFGDRQAKISRWVVRALLLIGIGGGLGMVLEGLRIGWTGGMYDILNGTLRGPLEWIDAHASFLLRGWPGWLFWSLIIRLLMRVEHPPVPDRTPLDRRRMVVGWSALALFVLTFSWTGIFDRTHFSPGSDDSRRELYRQERVIIEKAQRGPFTIINVRDHIVNPFPHLSGSPGKQPLR